MLAHFVTYVLRPKGSGYQRRSRAYPGSEAADWRRDERGGSHAGSPTRGSAAIWSTRAPLCPTDRATVTVRVSYLASNRMSGTCFLVPRPLRPKSFTDCMVTRTATTTAASPRGFTMGTIQGVGHEVLDSAVVWSWLLSCSVNNSNVRASRSTFARASSITLATAAAGMTATPSESPTT